MQKKGKHEGSVERNTRRIDPGQPMPQFDGKMSALVELLCGLKDDRSEIGQRVQGVEQNGHKRGVEWFRPVLDAKEDLS